MGYKDCGAECTEAWNCLTGPRPSLCGHTAGSPGFRECVHSKCSRVPREAASSFAQVYAKRVSAGVHALVGSLSLDQVSGIRKKRERKKQDKKLAKIKTKLAKIKTM